jgi:hypothetical protein
VGKRKIKTWSSEGSPDSKHQRGRRTGGFAGEKLGLVELSHGTGIQLVSCSGCLSLASIFDGDNRLVGDPHDPNILSVFTNGDVLKGA